ncbi:MAG: DUF5615 family PIN-like protein [Deltaproteobacteria bacterium]|nr:DUF5615 family PIN-like protein [Deltaproteobacteria bacterium]
MKFLIDLNLPPSWTSFFRSQGWDAVHWSRIGDYTASDHIILTWARDHNYIVFNQDLDFGAVLASSADNSPSVSQLRSQNILPESICSLVIKAIRQFEKELLDGALISIDQQKARIRILPLRRD